jgi:hypothetical protein
LNINCLFSWPRISRITRIKLIPAIAE